MSKLKYTDESIKPTKEIGKKLQCGIVMPISSHSDYPKDHWNDVLNILIESIDETDFKPSLVSEDPAVGLIHERIVTNLYYNEIVVCDVSSKNPNVMFELGLRIAFDKPTIIIKDDLTTYNFDTGVIEHIPYPASLRFADIKKFKEILKSRIHDTYQASINDSHYSPFLKSFSKKITPAKVGLNEISESAFIIEALKTMQTDIGILKNQNFNQTPNLSSPITLKSAYETILRSRIKRKFNERGAITISEIQEEADNFSKTYNTIAPDSVLFNLALELGAGA